MESSYGSKGSDEDQETPVFDGVNGRDPETGILYYNGIPVKESRRKPRPKKGENMNFGAKNSPKTISLRALLDMVGGIVDAQRGDHKGIVKRPTEKD